MDIYTFSISRLRNLAHFEFHSEVKQLVNKNTAEKLNIVEAFATFTALLDKEKEGLEVIRQHKLTAQLMELDEKRDHTFSGVVANIKSFTKHFDQQKAAIAQELERALKNYGNLSIKNYNEETAGLEKLTDEFLTNYNDELTTLGLEEWVTHLQTLNNEFKELMLSRNDDLTEKEPIHMRTVRKEIDAVYRIMVKRVEASALLNGKDDYQDFINELNGRIEYYKEHNL